jgi:16S rRNA (uracil1498-N3)-methyltransferase
VDGAAGAEPAETPLAAARRAAAHVIVDDLDSPTLSEDDTHHVRSVLRLRAGERVSVTDGNGGWRLCVWTASGALDPICPVERVGPPEPAVTVAFAPVKGDRNEWAVQKLAELGVDRIVLLRAERSVVRWDSNRSASQLSRFRRLVRQAVMQSRSLWVPSVDGVMELASLAGSAGSALADPSGTRSWADVSTVLVGPEGGWSEGEWDEYGSGAVRLGGGVLRTESAAVAAGVLLTALRSGIVAPDSSERDG